MNSSVRKRTKNQTLTLSNSEEEMHTKWGYLYRTCLHNHLLLPERLPFLLFGGGRRGRGARRWLRSSSGDGGGGENGEEFEIRIG